MGEIVSLRADSPEADHDLLGRIEGVLAIFRAIDAGELLCALPECEVARTQHHTAVALLAVAERELISIYQDAGR